MGNHFVTVRNLEAVPYSERRKSRRLNDNWQEPHRMRAFGLGTGKFSVRQMFERNQRRAGNRRVKRTVKKAARQDRSRDLQNT